MSLFSKNGKSMCAMVRPEDFFMSTSTIVRGECGMQSMVRDSDTTYLVFGGPGEPLDIMFDTAALRCLLDLLTRSVAEVDKRHAELKPGVQEIDRDVFLRPGDTR